MGGSNSRRCSSEREGSVQERSERFRLLVLPLGEGREGLTLLPVSSFDEEILIVPRPFALHYMDSTLVRELALVRRAERTSY